MDNMLEKEKIGKLLLKLCIPTILAQVVNVLYNVVDRIYIGQMVGSLALTGVGVCMPLITIASAFAMLVAAGGAPKAAIAMGAKDNDKAEKIMSNCLTATVAVGVILTTVLLIFNEQLLVLVGATSDSLGYATEYMKIYSIGTIFVMTTLGMNMFITTQGYAKISMLTVIIGAGLNIVLDPLFIGVFNMGVAGAAWATVISQAVSCVFVIVFLFGKKTILKLKFKNMRIDIRLVLSCIALGLSPFVMQVTEGILQICFNVQLRFYGEMVGGNMDTIALGTMTILSSVMQFSFLPLSGLTQGAQPIVSYNFGAGNSERVKKTFKYELISAFAYASVIWVLVMAFPSLFAKIFVNSEDVFAGQIIELTSTALRIYMAVSLLFSMQMVCQQTFVSLGKAKISLFLAVLRKIVLLIPLIFILPAIFPSQAIIMIFTAEPIADIIAVIITVSVFFAKFKSIMAECDKNKCSIASDSATVTLESQTSIK